MTEKIVNIIKEVPFVGEDGLDYIKVTKEILTPRKTYLKGTITGKYRGDKILNDSDTSNLFDFEIYEAEVTCNSIDDFSKNKPFTFPHDFKNITNANKIKGTVFPKEKLPKTLPVIISAQNKSFGINVIEPQLFEFTINRKEHQIEGDEVFGSFNAYITGYVFDYEREEVEEIKLINIIDIDGDGDGGSRRTCASNGIKTGKEENKNGYIRYEYFCKHHPDTVWGPWEKIPCNDGCYKGCFSQILAVIGLLLFIAFLIAVLPGFIYIIGFFVMLFLIGLLGPYFKWIFRILGIILLIAFIGSLINAFNQRTQSNNPRPLIVDTEREKKPVFEPIIDTITTNAKDTIQRLETDSIITRYRKWQDYDGNRYEGKYQIKLSDYKKAHYYKNNLSLYPNSKNAYDEVVFHLKQFDKNKFNNVYILFDSIGSANKLDRIKFAKMIVSFVQDIPYVLILDKECDASLYDDNFTRNYLLSNQGKCDGPQRFGINTPVEFLTNLNGDCDTRTLLLYAILAYYKYDVALMSSEYYGHSILGINLPINGTAYSYNNQKYVLWETTSPNAKPGIISNEISNLNNWRISLKSK
jgi:hypothetical protein